MNYKREYPAIAAKFQAIAAETTPEDVLLASLEMGCHYETVRRYLRGEVAKEKFGLRLLSFLEGKVQDRNSKS